MRSETGACFLLDIYAISANLNLLCSLLLIIRTY